jgi:hypothetical protein
MRSKMGRGQSNMSASDNAQGTEDSVFLRHEEIEVRASGDYVMLAQHQCGSEILVAFLPEQAQAVADAICRAAKAIDSREQRAEGEA